MPSPNARRSRPNPVGAAFADYLGTPPSEKRPIEEYLPGLRLETVAAVMNPTREARVIDADHGSEDEARSEDKSR